MIKASVEGPSRFDPSKALPSSEFTDIEGTFKSEPVYGHFHTAKGRTMSRKP